MFPYKGLWFCHDRYYVRGLIISQVERGLRLRMLGTTSTIFRQVQSSSVHNSLRRFILCIAKFALIDLKSSFQHINFIELLLTHRALCKPWTLNLYITKEEKSLNRRGKISQQNAILIQMYYFAVSFASLFTYVPVLDNGIVERITQQWIVRAFTIHATSSGNHRYRVTWCWCCVTNCVMHWSWFSCSLDVIKLKKNQWFRIAKIGIRMIVFHFLFLLNFAEFCLLFLLT